MAIDNIDFDQVPDTRPTRRFRRGDSNDDGAVDVSDAITTLGVLFLGDGEITCRDAAEWRPHEIGGDAPCHNPCFQVSRRPW